MKEWEYRTAADQDLPPGEKLRSLKREAGLASFLAQSCWRLFVYGYLLTYHRLRIVGREHLPPAPPFVLVSNHSSHLDALSLASCLPWRLRQRAFPIAAGDHFFETPISAFFSALMFNALPMWRHRCGRHALDELRERLVGEPAIYILFPEGTRSRDGEVARFKSGIGMLVAGSKIPVVPCYLQGAHEALPPHRSLPRPRKLVLRIGPPEAFEETENKSSGWKEISNRLETAVKGLGSQGEGRTT